MTWTQMVTFAGVVSVGAMSPGPDFVVVVRRAVAGGRKAGTAAAAGVATGVFVWALAAAVGLVALLSIVPQVLTAIRIAGAAYLVYLGVQAWRNSGTPEASPPHHGSAFRDGLLCNVLNPKAAVFFVAFLPQFLPARPGPLDILLLSIITVAITLAWFTVVAQAASLVRRLLSRPRVRRAMDAVCGTALVALGARLALSTAR